MTWLEEKGEGTDILAAVGGILDHASDGSHIRGSIWVVSLPTALLWTVLLRTSFHALIRMQLLLALLQASNRQLRIAARESGTV